MAVQTGVRIAQKPVGIITVPAMELPTEDGEPLETSWHRSEINLLIEMVRVHWRGRQDFYAGGNMFIYYSLQQARNRDYRGPDFFVVRGVDGSSFREAWVVWEEGGKYPDVIVELLSESTAKEDLTTKKDLYERTFRTAEYFCYDPDTHLLRGWQLIGPRYEVIKPSPHGWLWSEQLRLWLGLWEGRYLEEERIWLRFYNQQGELVPTFGELEAEVRHQAEVRAEQEAEARRQEAEARHQAEARAQQAKAQLARLRAELEQLRGRQAGD